MIREKGVPFRNSPVGKPIRICRHSKAAFKTINVISHLLDDFEVLGEIPEQIVIDQDKVMVISENSGDISYTKEFRDFPCMLARKLILNPRERLRILPSISKPVFLSVYPDCEILF